jgi:Ribbon-helix-helix protein, copG family
VGETAAISLDEINGIRIHSYTMTQKRGDAVVPVRIPHALLRKLDIIAKKQDRSRSYTIRALLDRAVAEELREKGGKQ